MEKRLEISASPVREIGDITSLRNQSQLEYDLYIRDFINRRVKQGIRLRTLIRHEDRGDEFEQTSDQLLKEVRVLPDHFTIEPLMSTFGSYLSINTLKGNTIFGLTINDDAVTAVFNSMFDYIWQQRPVNKQQ